jgi:hypothetical protein
MECRSSNTLAFAVHNGGGRKHSSVQHHPGSPRGASSFNAPGPTMLQCIFQSEALRSALVNVIRYGELQLCIHCAAFK